VARRAARQGRFGEMRDACCSIRMQTPDSNAFAIRYGVDLFCHRCAGRSAGALIDDARSSLSHLWVPCVRLDHSHVVWKSELRSRRYVPLRCAGLLTLAERGLDALAPYAADVARIVGASIRVSSRRRASIRFLKARRSFFDVDSIFVVDLSLKFNSDRIVAHGSR
jgi:hypothetical protein